MNTSHRPSAKFLSPETTGMILAITGAVLFSAKGILVKFLYADNISTITIIFFRMLFALPIFMGIALMAWHKTKIILTKRDLCATIICGLLSYYISTWLNFYGLHYISVQLERLILFSYPTLVILATALLTRRLPDWRILIACALTYGGILLVFGHDLLASPETPDGQNIILGAGLVALSACTFAAYVILSKSLILKLGTPIFTGISMTAATIAICLHVIVTTSMSDTKMIPVGSANAYILLVLIGLLGTVAPALMVNTAIGRIGAPRTSILGSVGPIVTSLLAVSLLGESFTVFHISAIILCGLGVGIIFSTSAKTE